MAKPPPKTPDSVLMPIVELQTKGIIDTEEAATRANLSVAVYRKHAKRIRDQQNLIKLTEEERIFKAHHSHLEEWKDDPGFKECIVSYFHPNINDKELVDKIFRLIQLDPEL